MSHPTRPQYHVRYHPEEEGRFAERRSVPEMHQRLLARGLSISQREATHLMQRYEELVTDAESRTSLGSRHAYRSKDT